MHEENREKASTSGTGGWRSYRRREARPDVRALVQSVAREGKPIEAPAPCGRELLLERFVWSKSGSYKINLGRDGQLWHKASWPQGPHIVYVIVQSERPGNSFAALVDLCELVLECEWGLRKPSVDKWASR